MFDHGRTTDYVRVTDRDAAKGNGDPPFPTFRWDYLCSPLRAIGGHTPQKC
jgi:hypothetical protein